MPAIGDRIAFNHFPRTAGTYLSTLMEQAGYVKYCEGNAHRLITPEEAENRLVFVVLRDPADWLKSYFEFRCRGGRACVPEIDTQFTHRDSFGAFCGRLTIGTLDAVYNYFTADNYEKPTAFCSYCYLGGDVNEYLDTIGLASLPIASLPIRHNVGDTIREYLKARNPNCFKEWSDDRQDVG